MEFLDNPLYLNFVFLPCKHSRKQKKSKHCLSSHAKQRLQYTCFEQLFTNLWWSYGTVTIGYLPASSWSLFWMLTGLASPLSWSGCPCQPRRAAGKPRLLCGSACRPSASRSCTWKNKNAVSNPELWQSPFHSFLLPMRRTLYAHVK